MDANIIFIIGPQGSGKGTQAEVLAKRLGFFYWSMGGILREERNFPLSNGQTVAEIIDRGKLLEDSELLEVFRARMATIPAGQGIIFEGIPRRIGQAEFIFDFLASSGRTGYATVFLDLPREDSLKRLIRRAEIEKRADDTPEAMEFRLKQYEEATVPVLDYLKQHTTFFTIDGRPAIPEVTKEIFDALGLS